MRSPTYRAMLESWSVARLAERVIALEDHIQAAQDAADNWQHGINCPSQAGWASPAPCTCGKDRFARVGL